MIGFMLPSVIGASRNVLWLIAGGTLLAFSFARLQGVHVRSAETSFDATTSRGLQETNVDTNFLEGALKELKLAVSELGKEENTAILSENLPLLGKSIIDIFANGETLDSLFNAHDKLDQQYKDVAALAKETAIEAIREAYTEAANVLTAVLPVSDINVLRGPICTGKTDALDIAIPTIKSNELTIEICSQLGYEYTSDFDSESALSSVSSAMKMDISGQYIVAGAITFGTKITVKENQLTELIMDPIIVSTFLKQASQTELLLGLASFEADADIELETSMKITFDLARRVIEDINPKGSKFEVKGDISLISESLDGLESVLGSGATYDFNVTGSNLFTESEEVEVSIPTLPNFAQLASFSLEDALAMVRTLDSSVSRSLENAAFDVNVPFLKSKLSEALGLGGVFQSGYFDNLVQPQSPSARGQKSLFLTAQGAIECTDISDPITLILYIVENFNLNVDPEQLERIDELATSLGTKFEITVACENANLAANLVMALNDKRADIACGASDACKEDGIGDVYGCAKDCTVFINTKKDEQGDDVLFMKTVGFSDQKKKGVKDIQLILLRSNSTSLGELIEGLNIQVAPAHTPFVPSFRNGKNLVDAMNDAIKQNADLGDIAIQFEYSEAPAGSSMFPELSVAISFAKKYTRLLGNVTAFDNTIDFGDLASITATDVNLVLAPSINFSLKAGVILGPDPTEKIVVVGQACKEDMLCTLGEPKVFFVEFIKTINGVKEPLMRKSVTVAPFVNNDVTKKLREAFDAVPELTNLIEVRQVNPEKRPYLIEFDGIFSDIKIIVKKNCLDARTNDLKQPDVYECDKKEKVEKIKDDVFGLKDTDKRQIPFQFGIGETQVNSNLNLNGIVKVLGNVGDVIEASAEVALSMTMTNFQASINPGGALLPFNTWISNIAKLGVSNDELPSTFFQANVIFTAILNGNLAVTEPFQADVATFQGSLDPPYQVDFLTLNKKLNKPQVVASVDIPELGSIQEMSFEDVCGGLDLLLEFLVGDPEEGDSLFTCSGGLLGKKVAGQNIFNFEFPVLGISACRFASLLQVFSEAVAAVCTGTSTFTRLDSMLTDALTDEAAAEAPTVDVNVEAKAEAGSDYSDLEVTVKLEWDFDESFSLKTDLAEILEAAGVDDNGDLSIFLQTLIAAEGSSMASMVGTLTATLSLGLEYNELTKEARPYVQGITGIALRLGSSGTVAFEGALGPIAARMEATFCLGKDADRGNCNVGPADFYVGFSPDMNYYLDFPTAPPLVGRSGFDESASFGNLISKLDFSFDGGLDAAVTIEALLSRTIFDIGVADIHAFITQEPNVVALTTTFENGMVPETPKSFLEVLLTNPTAFLEGIDGALASVENASLGSQGILAKFPVPVIKDALSKSLNAGTDQNPIALARRGLLRRLQEKLESYSDGTEVVADILGTVMNNALDSLGVLEQGKGVIAKYFTENEEEIKNYHSDQSAEVKAVQWTVPLGQSIQVPVPLDFEVENAGLPLRLTTAADGALLEISWSFQLTFGFQESSGFYVLTSILNDDRNDNDDDGKLSVKASFVVENLDLDGKLFFLKAAVKKLDVAVVAALFVSMDKQYALRSVSSSNGDSPRLTRSDLTKIPDKSDLFRVRFTAGATLRTDVDALQTNDKTGISFSVNLPKGQGLDEFEAWIPSIGANSVGIQLKYEIDSANESNPQRRRLLARSHRVLTEKDLRFLLDDNDGFHHPSANMMFRELQDGCNVRDDLECIFDLCDDDILICAAIEDVHIELSALADFLDPVMSKITGKNRSGDTNEEGYLGKAVDALDTLDQPIQPLEKLSGEEVSILDIAEMIYPQAGVDTVRRFIRILKGIKDLVNDFASDGRVTFYDRCTFSAGDNDPKCAGAGSILAENSAQVGKDSTRRLQVGLLTRAKDLGLSIPWIEDPFQLIRLLTGKDIILVEFDAPVVTFGFQYKYSFVVYTPPTVMVGIFFEFTASLKFGAALDTKGIRAAVEGKGFDQIANSFALKDTFDGVDEALLTLTGKVGFDVSVDAVIVKVGVTGGIGVIATIDLFDPYPETSNGLVRPYELITVGTSPLEWFEFELSIRLLLSLYVKVGLFLGPFEITLYTFDEKWEKDLINPLRVRPSKPATVATLEGGSGELKLSALEGTKQLNPLTYRSIGGVIGKEDIEVRAGIVKDASEVGADEELKEVIVSHEGVSRLSFRNAAGDERDIILRGIQSPFDLSAINVGSLKLDYSEVKSGLINRVELGQRSVSIGAASVAFNTIGMKGGVLAFPRPFVGSFQTTVDQCNSAWTFDGYSNVKVNADRVLSGCSIKLDDTTDGNARLEISFNPTTSTSSCTDGNRVTISKEELQIFDDNTNLRFAIAVGKMYKTIKVVTTQCSDTVELISTVDDSVGITIQTHGGDDTVIIGSTATSGFDALYGPVVVDGGTHSSDIGDTIIFRGTSSTESTNGILGSSILQDVIQATALQEQYGNVKGDVEFFNFENLEIHLPSLYSNNLLVESTTQSSSTKIFGGIEKDVITVEATQGLLRVEGDSGDDDFRVKSLGADAEFLGEGGNDSLVIENMSESSDGSASTVENTIDGTNVVWSGGSGDDTLTTYFVSTGTTNIDLRDDRSGKNIVNLDCANVACTVLSRASVLANIHDVDNPSNTTMERINVILDDAGEPTATFSFVNIRLNEGENEMFFDDTMSTMTVIGGPNDDRFHFGQLFNADRDERYGVLPDVYVDTTNTTRGYLSPGCQITHTVNVKGGFGNDLFDVLSNQCQLVLNGESGDDFFIVRSFALLRKAQPPGFDFWTNEVFDAFGFFDWMTKKYLNENEENLIIMGGDDSDTFQFDELPDSDGIQYDLKNLVDVDGGTGFDIFLTTGTEFDDRFVIDGTNLYGGGLAVATTNINEFRMLGMEGDDTISIIKTSPGTSVRVFGGKGSDRIEIAPRRIEPVVSKNLLGHQGIIEHYLQSEDLSYDGLDVPGVLAHILDNDGDYGYMRVVLHQANNVLTEDGAAFTTFEFSIFPTRMPKTGKSVVVEVKSQLDDKFVPYALANGEGILELVFTSISPVVVEISYNSDAEALAITHQNLAIQLEMKLLSTDYDLDTRFVDTEQSLKPVDFVLLPSRSSLSAISIWLEDSTVIVAEGPHGTTSEYRVHLLPCTADMKNGARVTITPTFAEQVMLSLMMIGPNEWGNECMATVQVTAVDDNIREGFHIVTLVHEVSDEKGDPIILTDKSQLLVESAVVHIYDNDTPGIIITETLSITDMAELKEEDADALTNSGFSREELFDDSYTIRLTQEPKHSVALQVASMLTSYTLPGSDNLQTRGKLEQVFVNGDVAAELTFTPSNWMMEQTIKVQAIDDDIAEGIELVNFAPQMSSLAFIQGRVFLSGGIDPDVPDIGNPLLLPPNEFDEDIFEPPPGFIVDISTLFTLEDKQVDTLTIYDRDAFNSEGSFNDHRLVGMKMPQEVYTSGNRTIGGITYEEFEIIELFTGSDPDKLDVVNTSAAIHVFETGEGDDVLTIRNVQGHFFVFGNEGSDTVTVTADEAVPLLESINALVGFDGGTKIEDSGVREGGFGAEFDILVLDNSADENTKDVLELTRTTLELVSLDKKETSTTFSSALVGRTSASRLLQFKTDKRETTSAATILCKANNLHPIDGCDGNIARTMSLLMASPFNKDKGKNDTEKQHDRDLGVNIETLDGTVNRKKSTTLMKRAQKIRQLKKRKKKKKKKEKKTKKDTEPETELDETNKTKEGKKKKKAKTKKRKKKKKKTKKNQNKSNDVPAVLLSEFEETTNNVAAPVVLPRNSFYLRVASETQGVFKLTIKEQGDREVVLTTNIALDGKNNALLIEGYLHEVIFPRRNACGEFNNQRCSSCFKAVSMSYFILVFLIGECRDRSWEFSWDPTQLQNVDSEIYLDGTRDLFYYNSDVAYSKVEQMEIKLGSQEHVLNIRGTSAETYIYTQGSDDKAFVSSDANERHHTAGMVDTLDGWLDYIEKKLTLQLGSGTHRLFVSDERSEIPKGQRDDPGILTRNSLTNLRPGAVGDIFFFAEGGNFFDDARIWFGRSGDAIKVTSVPSLADTTTRRRKTNRGKAVSALAHQTVSKMEMGPGDDTLVIELEAAENVGASFICRGEEGNDTINAAGSSLAIICFGDEGDDHIVGGSGDDVLFGDSGTIEFYEGTGYPWTLITTKCRDGGRDVISGGDGHDILVGGSLKDTISGNDGHDLVFGDHVYLELMEGWPQRIKYATSEPNCACTAGNDVIHLNDGDDIAFGGGGDDTIYGGTGSDVILGDFGLYRASTDYLPNQLYEPVISCTAYAGNDVIYGGDGDDFLYGQEGEDKIYGGEGNDDIFGGHSKIGGKDSGDKLYGHGGADAVLGDNGEIVRTMSSAASMDPWPNGIVWQTYGAPFNSEPVREIRRYDDADLVGGNDVIYGGKGNDVLHGQRGNDVIHGDEGEDELYGELGNDTLYGGKGNDILIGDIGYAIRRHDDDTKVPRLNSLATMTSGKVVWHKDVVLEDLGIVKQVVPISTKVNLSKLSAKDIMSSSMAFIAKDDRSNKNFLVLFDLDDTNSDDVLVGGQGDDVLIGQRGDDRLNGGSGNDFLVGDFGSNYIPFHGNIPQIHQIYRAQQQQKPSSLSSIKIGNPFGLAFTSKLQLKVEASHSRSDRTILESMPASTVYYHSNQHLGDEWAFAQIVENMFGLSCLCIDNSSINCIIPLVQMSPGVGILSQKQKQRRLLGDDELQSGGGNDILIGDGFEGRTAVDWSELGSPIEGLSSEINELYEDLVTRFIVMELDVENFKGIEKPFTRNIGADSIKTHKNGNSIVAGDYLFLKGRSIPYYATSSKTYASTAMEVNSVLMDVYRGLVDLQFCLFEAHTDLLKQILRAKIPNRRGTSQRPNHELVAGSDQISSFGEDVVVGDTVHITVEVDRPGKQGFVFNDSAAKIRNNLRSDLYQITERQLEEIWSQHVPKKLKPSDPLTTKLLTTLPFDDVQHEVKIGMDSFDIASAKGGLIVGDHGMFHLTESSRATPPPSKSSKSGTKTSRRVLKKKRKKKVSKKSKASKQSGKSTSTIRMKTPCYCNRAMNTSAKSKSKSSSSKILSNVHSDLFKVSGTKSIVFGDDVSVEGFRSHDSGTIQTIRISSEGSKGKQAKGRRTRRTTTIVDSLRFLNGDRLNPRPQDVNGNLRSSNVPARGASRSRRALGKKKKKKKKKGEESSTESNTVGNDSKTSKTGGKSSKKSKTGGKSSKKSKTNRYDYDRFVVSGVGLKVVHGEGDSFNLHNDNDHDVNHSLPSGKSKMSRSTAPWVLPGMYLLFEENSIMAQEVNGLYLTPLNAQSMLRPAYAGQQCSAKADFVPSRDTWTTKA